MQLIYTISIENPHQHLVLVKISGKRPNNLDKLTFFMPSWCPGSYLMREYSSHVQCFSACDNKGRLIYFSQIHKNLWEIDWNNSACPNDNKTFEISYQVYCHEVSVRTSYVDSQYAFIHGPSIFMGILEDKVEKPIVKISFPANWNKITTSLSDISKDRKEFLYQSSNYDSLLDSPIQIGNHYTDGFYCGEKEHGISFVGDSFLNNTEIKSDIKKIVETIANTMGDMPYKKYNFIAQFIPKTYGGLEHSDCCILQYPPEIMVNRKGYINFLSLVAHEYFHVFNGKRIRPIELGPFDYTKESITKMLWLVEGLTSYMDNLFVYRSGLCLQSEYLEVMKNSLNDYFKIPGRYFHSLEQSSLNAWIKLYRPNENNINTTISYYLKGELVFWMLDIMLFSKGKSIDNILDKLWSFYKEDPHVGIIQEQFYNIVEDIAGADISSKFKDMVVGVEDINFESYLKSIGLKLKYQQNDEAYLGVIFDNSQGRLIIKSVLNNGPASKYGLNAKDEIIAIDGIRVFNLPGSEFYRMLAPHKTYKFTLSRNNRILDVDCVASNVPSFISEIVVESSKISKKFFKNI